MATKNLSDYNKDLIPSAKGMKFGIVIAEWNYRITSALSRAAIETLKNNGANYEDIVSKHVPGTFELPLGGQFFAEYSDVDAVILIGCVIRGETPHFEYVCDSVTQGSVKLNLKYNKPFVFSVLTTNNEQQALDRAGGKMGNKGDEAAITAIKMVYLKREMQNIKMP